MATKMIKRISAYIVLCRDDKTGIAWVQNGSAGVHHTAHPNVHATGRTPWPKDERTVRQGAFIYNIDRCTVSDDYDRLAAQHCKCGGNHETD